MVPVLSKQPKAPAASAAPSAAPPSTIDAPCGTCASPDLLRLGQLLPQLPDDLPCRLEILGLWHRLSSVTGAVLLRAACSSVSRPCRGGVCRGRLHSNSIRLGCRSLDDGLLLRLLLLLRAHPRKPPAARATGISGGSGLGLAPAQLRETRGSGCGLQLMPPQVGQSCDTGEIGASGLAPAALTGKLHHKVKAPFEHLAFRACRRDAPDWCATAQLRMAAAGAGRKTA